MNKIVKLIINFVLIAIVVVALSVGNSILFKYENQINTLLAPPIIDDEVLSVSSENGQAMARRIMTEGAVMLKNNGALPLDYSTDKQVNVFGWRSVDWMYGSAGQSSSGTTAPENDDFSENIDLCEALNKYGIKYNTRLYDMYCDYWQPDPIGANPRQKTIGEYIYLTEPNINDESYYTEDLLEYSKNYSDTALVVIGRVVGEHLNISSTTQVKKGVWATDDNTRHYLEISAEEEALLEYCGNNYDNVIVILNMPNVFECGFLETIPGIDSCLYVGYTGTRAAQAIPGLLYGEVSPSGRTVDTFAYDLFTNPANVWKGCDQAYLDYSRNYADYVEGIYVGYKWYETAYAEGIWDDYTRTGENGEQLTGYDAVVQFPLGYGMSYNEYSWEVGDITFVETVTNDDGTTGENGIAASVGDAFTDKVKIRIPVTVTNNGNYPGRDVVEVYVTPPYYGHGEESAIEKPAVTLAGFGKTNELQPGASETIEIVIDPYDFASYDCYDRNGNEFKGWELEHGDYVFSLRTDAHTVKTVKYGSSDQAGNFTFSVAADITIPLDPVTGKEVGNLFTGEDAVDATPLDGIEDDFVADIPWFTRKNFYVPSEFTSLYKRRNVNPSAKQGEYNAERAIAWDNATGEDEFGDPIPTEKPTWGNGGSLRLADDSGNITELGKQLGADYDDPKWEEVLNQIEISEVVSVINQYYGTKAIPSVGKPKLTDLDGPAQIKSYNFAPRGTGYPAIVVLSASWNDKLAYEFGKAFGDDMNGVGVDGLWGWAMDTHRNAWFGRNHESPSEDGFLAGTIMKNAVKGLNTRGKYCFIKHFATYGHGGATTPSAWMSEQTLREVYLRPFRMSIVEGGALGVMTAFQGLGAEYAETTQALITGVLRREWDFKGAITTDWVVNNPRCDALIRAGGNLGMANELGSLSGVTYNENSSARLQHRLRDSIHQVLYMWLHADYNEQQYLLNPDDGDTFVSSTAINGWVWWKPLIYTIDLCAGALCAMWAGLVLVSFFLKKKKQPDPELSDPDALNGYISAGGGSEESAATNLAHYTAVTPPPADEPTETSDNAGEEPEAEESAFESVYAALPDDAKDRFEAVRVYVASKPGMTEKRTDRGVQIKDGVRTIVKLGVRRGEPVAFFDLENDELRAYRKQTGAAIPRRNTVIKLRDETSVGAACRMADIMEEQLAHDREEAKERRREARRARREQEKAAADEAKENGDEHKE